MARESDGTDDKFEETVGRLLRTPPKPHKGGKNDKPKPEADKPDQ